MSGTSIEGIAKHPSPCFQVEKASPELSEQSGIHRLAKGGILKVHLTSPDLAMQRIFLNKTGPYLGRKASH